MHKSVIDRLCNMGFQISYDTNVEDFLRKCNEKPDVDAYKMDIAIQFVLEQYIFYFSHYYENKEVQEELEKRNLERRKDLERKGVELYYYSDQAKIIRNQEAYEAKKYMFFAYLKDTISSYFGKNLNMHYNGKNLLFYLSDIFDYEPECVLLMMEYLIKQGIIDINKRVKFQTFLEYTVIKKDFWKIYNSYLYDECIKEKYDFFAKNPDNYNFFEFFYKYSADGLIRMLIQDNLHFLPEKIIKKLEKLKEVYSIVLNEILSDIELKKEKIRYEKKDDISYDFYINKKLFAEFVIKYNIDRGGEKLFEIIENEEKLREKWKKLNEKEDVQKLPQALNRSVIEKVEDKKILLSRIDKILQVKILKKEKTEKELEEIDLLNKFKSFILEEQPRKTLNLKQ